MFSGNIEPIVPVLVCQLAQHEGRIVHSRPAVSFISPDQYDRTIQGLAAYEGQVVANINQVVLDYSIAKYREALAEAFLTTSGRFETITSGYLCHQENTSWFSPPVVHASTKLPNDFDYRAVLHPVSIENGVQYPVYWQRQQGAAAGALPGNPNPQAQNVAGQQHQPQAGAPHWVQGQTYGESGSYRGAGGYGGIRNWR